jgi:hypothetical protein
MADRSVEIAAIEKILNAGTSSVSVDGLSASYDLDALRKRLLELKAEDDNATKRPTILTARMPFH